MRSVVLAEMKELGKEGKSGEKGLSNITAPSLKVVAAGIACQTQPLVRCRLKFF